MTERRFISVFERVNVFRSSILAAIIALMSGCAGVDSFTPPSTTISNNGANPNIAAANSKFARYPEYLQRVANSVQKCWETSIDRFKTYPPSGASVVVSFILAPDGSIAQIENVESHAPEVGAQLAVAALTQSAPFAPWSTEMKSQLNPAGEELVFTFYYQ